MRIIQIGKKIEVVEKRLKLKEVLDFIQHLKHDDIALAPCPCRTGTEINANRDCHDRNPLGACVFFGISAVHIEEKGFGKRISRQNAVRYFDLVTSYGLHATVDNELSDNSVVCLCCGCCCSHLGFNYAQNNAKSPFTDRVIPEAGPDCLFCKKCANVCFFDAIEIDVKKKIYRINEDKCIGCGLCVFSCPEKSLKLVNKKMEK